MVMNDQKSRPVNAEPLPERPANPAVNEPVDATHRAERRQSASVEPATTGTASTGNEQPGTASQRPAAIPSVEKVQPSLITKNQDTKNEQAPEPEVINADYDPGMFAGEAENTDDQNSNLKKMHSLSFSIGQLLRGKYKPPQRSFGQSTMEMYRGTASYFSTSLYFVPEATEYARPMSKSRENSYGAGWALSYHTSHYLIQGGIEMVRSNDLGDYMVNMTSWDSVGYYQHVTGFVIDPDNPDSVILQTETVTIMDSVDHQSHQQTHNRYTYLQFPLMIGYKAMESGIFSAYIKAGPSFSFLLNTKEPPLNYSRPDATINGIDNFTAPRLSMNIQILVSLSLNFQITERFGILIEPTYRYYLNPVYDLNGESLKNPYGIGARGGLFINF